MNRGARTVTLSALLLAAACNGGGETQPVDGRPDAAIVDGAVPDGGPDGRPDAAVDAAVDAAADAMVVVVPPDVDGRLVINEFMASNARTIPADPNPGVDWIELYNPTGQTIQLAGYALTDDLAVPRKHVLASGAAIPAGGRLVLWADDGAGNGPLHLGFHLATEGGAIGFSRPDGTWIDRVTYGAQETDFSAARGPDGSDRWSIEWHPTPGTANLGTGGEMVAAEDVALPPEVVPAAGDLSERILGYDVMPELELVVPPASEASLLANPQTLVPAHLKFDGRTYGPVGIRLKGQNSFQPWNMKPSIRIKVDEYHDDARFFGLKDMTLNNMDNDFSMMHERLGYWVARNAGIPASRANHALLTVNGNFYGLYTNLETVKGRMIKRWFTDAEGPLFEATDVDFAPHYVSQFDLEGGPDDRTLLTGLANALTTVDPDAAIAASGMYANMNQFRRFWAVESVIAQFDSWPYSIPGDDFFVYADPTTHRLAFIPWGMDESFYSGQLDVTNVSSVLARKCKASPACFQAYVDQVWDVLAMTESMGLAAERNRVIAQIAPHVTRDTRKPYTDAQVMQSQQALYWFISGRRQNLGGMIPPPSTASARQRPQRLETPDAPPAQAGFGTLAGPALARP